MLRDIALAIWFFAPAGIANVTPIFAANIAALKKWDAPIDFGKSVRGIRILGAHKTWRGLIFGVLAATLIFGVQQLLVVHFSWAQSLTRSIDYRHLPTLIVGPLFGLGALGGDAIESFFKRQRRIPPGHGWFPFDQTDYIIGGALATAPYVRLELRQYAWLLILWLLTHLVASYIGFRLHLKDRPI